jgi:hypothetical protein
LLPLAASASMERLSRILKQAGLSLKEFRDLL